MQTQLSQTTPTTALKALGLNNSWLAHQQTGESLSIVLEMGHVVEHVGMLFKTINSDITDYAIFHETPALKQLVFMVCKHLLMEYSSVNKNPGIIPGSDIEFLENCAPVVEGIAEALGVVPSMLGYDLTSSLVHTTEMAFISLLDAVIQGLLSENRLSVKDFTIHNDFSDSNHFTTILQGVVRPAANHEVSTGPFA